MNTTRKRNLRHAAPCLVAALLALLFTAGMAGYRSWSSEHLPAMAAALGEVWMERAGRSERAGALEQARVQYERALAGTFHGVQNRVHSQKRLGVVLYALGRYTEALTYLQAAQESPHRSLNGYAPLVKTLIALDRRDAAKAVLVQWQTEAESTGGLSAEFSRLRDAATGGEDDGGALEPYLRTAAPDEDTATLWTHFASPAE